jgi:hypothetical protein
MKRQKFTYILVFLALTISQPPATGQDSRPHYRKLKLPAGTQFPASQRALLGMRDAADDHAMAEMRAHAWDLFAGLTKGETPIWDTWYTECDLGLLDCSLPKPKEPNSVRLLRNLTVPSQFLQSLSETSNDVTPVSTRNSELVNSTVLKFAQEFLASPQLASVLFNKEAKSRIQKDCLHPYKSSPRVGAADGCPKPKHSTAVSIRNFHRRTVALKMEWAPASKTNPRIWTYKPDLWMHVHDPRRYDPGKQMDRVNIKLPSIQPSDKDKCEDRDYKEDEDVPLSCFYYIRPKAEDLAALQQNKGLNDDVAASGVQPGDYLVLIAVHVTTKEIPDWVWATFWWARDGHGDKRAEGRPPTIGSQWGHFLMDTTLSGTTPTEKEDGGLKICFNPYLETKILFNHTPTGIVSNCLQCHSRASYAPGDQAVQFNSYDQGILARDGKTLEGSGLKPASDQEFFNGRLKTDFLWSISDAFTPRIQQLRGQLRLALQSLTTRANQ